MQRKHKKTHRSHQTTRHATHRRPSPKKKMASTTSSNWDQSVRAATGGASEIQEKSPSAQEQGEFTPGELGQPGPLDQAGEGNRQNDQLDELEHISPEASIKEETDENK